MTCRPTFGRRRAPTQTLDTSLSPHCLNVSTEIYEISTNGLHRPIRQVIVSPLWGSITCFTVINCRFSSFLCTNFFHFSLPKNLPREDETNTIVSLIFSRGRRNSWECFNLFPSFVDAVCHTPSSISVSSIIAVSNFSGSEHKRSLFYLGPST